MPAELLPVPADELSQGRVACRSSRVQEIAGTRSDLTMRCNTDPVGIGVPTLCNTYPTGYDADAADSTVRHFPEVAVAPRRSNGKGMSRLAYRTTGRWLCRRPSVSWRDILRARQMIEQLD